MEQGATLAVSLTGIAVVLFAAAWRVRWPAALVLLGIVLTGAAALAAALGDPASWADRSEATWRVVVLVATCALAVVGGGPVTTAVFELVDGRREDGEGTVLRAGEILRGGAWIGALERFAVFGTVVAGWPEGLALVLALKGLGRYPELRANDRAGIAERFIIGSFSSALWALVCAVIATSL